MPLRVCVAGVTGTVGRAVAQAVHVASDLELVGAVARSAAGKDIGEILGQGPTGIRICSTIDAALASSPDVLIDYTSPKAVKDHTLVAIRQRVGVVIGTSGLKAEDFEEIDETARAH